MKRREFLQSTGIIGVGLLTGCTPTSKSAPIDLQTTIVDNKILVDITKVNQLEPSVIAWGKKRIGVIKNTDGSFHASVMTCTHRGCTVSKVKEKGNYICPCHGARYTYQGKLTKGPAEQDLMTLTVTSDAQFIYIHLPTPQAL